MDYDEELFNKLILNDTMSELGIDISSVDLYKHIKTMSKDKDYGEDTIMESFCRIAKINKDLDIKDILFIANVQIPTNPLKNLNLYIRRN